MQTITELPEFFKKSNKLFSDDEKDSLIEFLSLNPKAGDLIKETGGIRKLRWSVKNKGKSGGVRIVYYYHNSKIPLFLLTLFGKGEKSNLSKYERNELSQLTKLLLKSYKE